MKEKPNWNRDCPKCGCELSYTSKRGLETAIDRNSNCRCCTTSGMNNPMWGKTHTKEVKEAQSRLKKGSIAWNRGLTKETDDRVKMLSEALTGKTKNFDERTIANLRENGRIRQKQWTYLKRGGLTDEEFLDKLPDLLKYRRMVRLMTYKVDTTELENYGIKGYELDHKFSIQEGFYNNIPPYIIANIHNLQYIPRHENRSKGIKCTETLENITLKTKLV